ncbi:hypothetical protein MMC06_004121 [Schaereria dolodes]|nr:hypothetical protein [Schaereria dolodes]
MLPTVALQRRSKSVQCSENAGDPRIGGVGRLVKNEYAAIRSNYRTPKHPIVLAHGLLGFDELRLAGKLLPGVHYWRGIKEALAANDIDVIIASVPSSGSIEDRAAKLSDDILKKAGRNAVSIIAHSMHHLIEASSAFADFVFESIGPERLPRIYKALEFLRMDTGAFSQLTRSYMKEDFNPRTPDLEGVRYFSYGATVEPSFWSAFRQSHRIIEREEGPNDGLVSVASSRWGGEAGYKGTLVGVSHLDLINWTNRLRWLVWEMTGNKRNFNAIAFYLDIADMLAKEGF